MELLPRQGVDDSDVAGEAWDEIFLTPVTSSYIRINGVSLYDMAGNPGFREIIVLANEGYCLTFV